MFSQAGYKGLWFCIVLMTLAFVFSLALIPTTSAETTEPMMFTWVGGGMYRNEYVWQHAPSWDRNSEWPGNINTTRTGDHAILTNRNTSTIKVTKSNGKSALMPLGSITVSDDITLELGYPLYVAALKLKGTLTPEPGSRYLMITNGTGKAMAQNVELFPGILKLYVLNSILEPYAKNTVGLLSIDVNPDSDIETLTLSNFIATVRNSARVVLSDDVNALCLDTKGDVFSVNESQSLIAIADASSKTLTLSGSMTVSGDITIMGTLTAGDNGLTIVAGDNGLTLQDTLALAKGNSVTISNGTIVSDDSGALIVNADLTANNTFTINKNLTVNGRLTAQDAVTIPGGATLVVGKITIPASESLTFTGAGSITAMDTRPNLENNGMLIIDGPKLNKIMIANNAGHTLNVTALDSASEVMITNNGTLNFNAPDNATIGSWDITAEDGSNVNFTGVHTYTPTSLVFTLNSGNSILNVASGIVLDNTSGMTNVNGNGRLTLSGAGAIIGTLNLYDGTIAVGKTNPVKNTALNLTNESAILEITDWGTNLSTLKFDANATLKINASAPTKLDSALKLDTLTGKFKLEFSDTALASLVTLSDDVTPILMLSNQSENNALVLADITLVSPTLNSMSLALSLSDDGNTLYGQLIADPNDSDGDNDGDNDGGGGDENDDDPGNGNSDSPVVSVQVGISFDLERLEQQGIDHNTRTVTVEIADDDGKIREVTTSVLFIASAPSVFPVTVTDIIFTLADGSTTTPTVGDSIYCGIRRDGQETFFDITDTVLNGCSFDLAAMLQGDNDEFELFFKIIRSDTSSPAVVCHRNPTLVLSASTDSTTVSDANFIVVGDGRLTGTISPDTATVTRGSPDTATATFDITWRNIFATASGDKVKTGLYIVPEVPDTTTKGLTQGITSIIIDSDELGLTSGDYVLVVTGKLASSDIVSADVTAKLTVKVTDSAPVNPPAEPDDSDVTGKNYGGGCNLTAVSLGMLGLLLGVWANGRRSRIPSK